MTTKASPLHANCVAVGDAGLLVMGASGRGKSALSLQMMGFGAELVADDRVLLETRSATLWARAPDTTQNLIEARGIGILNVAPRADVAITTVVDLDRFEDARMPPARQITLLGCALPLLYAVQAPHFAASLLQLMKAGMSHR